MALNFDSSALVLITGASQGIGRTLSVELAKKLKQKVVFVLVARSESKLNETKQLILAENPNSIVKISPLDLSKPVLRDYEDIVEDSLVLSKEMNLETCLIVHNAGQIGELKPVLELNELTTWQRYYDMNVFSVALLNSVFVSRFSNLSKRVLVINITSLCGREPFENMAMYGSAKAARDLYFKVLAKEEAKISVLNYSPGPVETPIIDDIIQNIKSDAMRGLFTDMRRNQTILTAEQTVGRLLGILGKGAFKSGDIIDYFDS